MIRFLGHFAVTAAAMMLLAQNLHGFTVRDWKVALLASVVLGFVNAIIKPILFLLTLPITIMTLGLFLLVLNAAMLALTAYFVNGFSITEPTSLLIASLVLALVGMVWKWMTGDGKKKRRDDKKARD